MRTDISVMRIAAAFAVVVIHIPGRGGHWGDLSRWAVPLFVMISGALLLGQSRPEPVGRFYRKRILRILPTLLFWNIVYFRVRYWGQPMTIGQAARTLLLGGGFADHLWFLPMILILYLATPLFRPYVVAMSAGRLRLALLLFFPLVWAYHVFVADQFGAPPMLLALPYLGYFVLGYYLDSRPAGRWPLWLAVFLTAFCVMQVGNHLLVSGPQLGPLGLNFSPCVAFMAVAVFQLCRLWFNRIPAPGAAWLHAAAAATLGVYLIHPLVIRATGWILPVETVRLTLSTMGLATAVFLTSLTASLFWRRLATNGTRFLAAPQPTPTLPVQRSSRAGLPT